MWIFHPFSEFYNTFFSGIIKSENYPDNYPNDFDRNYTINSDDDSIVITFSDFELEVGIFWDEKNL